MRTRTSLGGADRGSSSLGGILGRPSSPFSCPGRGAPPPPPPLLLLLLSTSCAPNALLLRPSLSLLLSLASVRRSETALDRAFLALRALSPLLCRRSVFSYRLSYVSLLRGPMIYTARTHTRTLPQGDTRK